MPASLVLLLRKSPFILTLRVDQDSGSRSRRLGVVGAAAAEGMRPRRLG
jgi:hypothetical protein